MNAWRVNTLRVEFSSDLPKEDIEVKLDEVKAKIQETKQTYRDATTAKGGSIWLVSTFKDLDEWEPEARREVSDIEWNWTT